MSKWVSVEGAIGAGKTTFLDKVIGRMTTTGQSSVVVIPEPVEVWESSGILSRSYTDPSFKFAAQCTFFTTRIETFRSLYNPSTPLHISERSPFSDKIFWTVNTKQEDPELHALYMSMWKMWQHLLPIRAPSLFIYLEASVDTCVKRVQERNRQAETGVSRAYQEAIVKEHNLIFLDPDGVEMPDGTRVPCLVVDSEANYRDDPLVAQEIADEIQKALLSED